MARQTRHADRVPPDGRDRARGLADVRHPRGRIDDSGSRSDDRHPLDRVRGDPAAQHTQTLRCTHRDPCRVHRDQRRPSGPGGDHRLALRHLHRRRLRVRHASSHRRSPAGRARIPGDVGGGDRHDDPVDSRVVRRRRHTDHRWCHRRPSRRGARRPTRRKRQQLGRVHPADHVAGRDHPRHHRHIDPAAHGDGDDPILR